MRASGVLKICLLFCLSLALVACSSTFSIPDTKDIRAIQKRGILRVGVNASIAGFGQKKHGKWTGFEVDLAKKMADDLGVKVAYVAVRPENREELLENGKVDCVMATYSITSQRKQRFDFSRPYYTSYVSVLVNDDSIQTLSNLNGCVIGVISHSDSARVLVQTMIDQGMLDSFGLRLDTFDATTWNRGISFRVYDEYDQLNEALRNGDIDGICADTSILNGYLKSGRHLIDNQFVPQKYGIATKKNSGLSILANREVKRWKKEGSIKALIKLYSL